MVSSPVSLIEDLNAAIQSHNPFNKTAIVKEQDIWGKGFPDLTTLNKKASDAVFQAIERVRTSQSSQHKVTSLAITAQKGVGKSHIISRIRHRLESEGGALFVYASVDNYADLNLIKYQFQQTLAESLKHTVSCQGVMQWQEVATAMANEALKARNTNYQHLSPEDMVKKFDQAYANMLAQNKNLMNDLLGKVLRNKPNAEPDIVRAILWTLSQSQAPFAINWLSGKELAQFKADELGLPNPSKTNQDREAEALNTVRHILNLVSDYNPVIICFDEIDVINDCGEGGSTTPEVIADLVKRLFDTLHQSELSRGVVILTVMMPDTWTQTVKQLSGGIPDRVVAEPTLNKQPLDLKHMDGDSIIELVTLWLTEFYDERNLTPSDKVYPFEESQLKELGKEKLPVREVLTWCAKNFKVYVEPLPTDPLERFEFAIKKESEAALGSYLEDNCLIAEGLCFGFQTLTGHTLEQVTIENIAEVKPKNKNNGFINFKVIGNENGKAVKIGVAVIQYSHHIALGAGLRRLIDYQTFDLTRGCLVRSKSEDKKIKRNTMYYKLLDQLTSELGGEFVELIEEQIRPLIDIHSVYQKRETYNLSKEQIFDFIFQKKLAFENLLLREILSAPSGQIPDDAVEDDMTIYGAFLSPSTTDDTFDSDDLTDLFN